MINKKGKSKGDVNDKITFDVQNCQCYLQRVKICWSSIAIAIIQQFHKIYAWDKSL